MMLIKVFILPNFFTVDFLTDILVQPRLQDPDNDSRAFQEHRSLAISQEQNNGGIPKM